MKATRGGLRTLNWDLTTGYKPTQWRSTISAPSCALCNKAVFPAEEVNGAGQKYHKLCLKCTSCNTLLNSGNLNEHEKKIYCVACYRRQFGPQGVGRGLGTASSLHLDTPPSSPSLRRMTHNINTEMTDTDGHRHQRKTSTGSSPSRTSSDDDSRHSNSTMNSVTYIGGVNTRPAMFSNARPSSTNLSNGSSFRLKTTGGNTCPRCSKTVYSAEEVKAAGKSFHKRCYTCAHCNKSINAARYSEHEGELYDNNCYQRLFGPKGIGHGIVSGALSTAN